MVKYQALIAHYIAVGTILEFIFNNVQGLGLHESGPRIGNYVSDTHPQILIKSHKGFSY